MRTILLLVCLAAPLMAAEDEDAKARVRGVRNYAKQGPAGIPLIAPYLDDVDPEVRWESVKAISDIGGATCIDPLIKASADAEGEIQVRAAEGLINVYLPGFLKTGLTAPLRKAGSSIKNRFTDTNTQIIDPTVQVRPDVIEALGKMARGGISMPARATAARGIGILRGRAALPDLYQALQSKDTAVLYESLIAIQKIRDTESGPRIQFLLKDPLPRVQLAAVETTGVLRNTAALPALREIAAGSGDIKVRRAALSAIAMMPDELNRPLYATYFQDRDEGLRAGAAEGYARLKNSSDLPALDKAFNDEGRMGPRLATAFALVMLGKRELAEFSPLQYLVNTLNSRSYRDVAAPYLIELTRDADIRRAVYPALDRATKEEKIRLADVLSRSGDAETATVLEKLQKDPDPEVAQEAARAIRNLQARLPK
ncbi:MAG: HEAT repeat domain-containing protein [Bryobacteraceae bacterium]|nr:HEAT repeat domain-containing protein [Bryobacteraceae bacterium]